MILHNNSNIDTRNYVAYYMDEVFIYKWGKWNIKWVFIIGADNRQWFKATKERRFNDQERSGTE